MPQEKKGGSKQYEKEVKKDTGDCITIPERKPTVIRNKRALPTSDKGGIYRIDARDGETQEF